MTIGTKLKGLFAVAVAGVFIASPAIYAADTVAEQASSGSSQTGQYTVTVDGATMTVDMETLNLQVEKNGRTWYSGRRASDDDGLNNIWVNKLTDAVTVGYRDIERNTSSERSMSLLDSSVDFEGRSDGFDAEINCDDIELTFTLEVRLSGDGLEVRVPYDSIEEESESEKLEYLLIYPFFDSSYSLVNGNILVPDGSGALMDLSVPTSASQAYSARVYGSDYGISASAVGPTSPEVASIPVLALMYDDGGTMLTAESGAEYCSVNAMVSGITTNYNLAYMQWIYRQTYVKYYQSSGTEGNSYIDFQTDKNVFDLVQKMTFLEPESSAADVAVKYRQSLGLGSMSQDGDAGLRLEFLMSENKQGMFGLTTVTMTTTEYVDRVSDWVDDYCSNLNISILGYTRGGLNGSYPNHFPLESSTGGNRGYSSLSQSLAARGINLSFVTDYVRAYESASVNERRYALNISNQFITINDSRAGSSARYNLLNAGDAVNYLSEDLETIREYGAGIDYTSIGSLLYSGYENAFFSRKDAEDIFVQALSGDGVNTNVIRPNAYMWSICDSYLEAPLSSSGYMIETSSVPFLQMVLSGSMEMYSRAINLNYTGREQVLRLIDYNVYPSFTLTEEDALELYGTNSSGIFTSSYAVWGDTVKSIYTEVGSVLSQVYGCTVTDRYSVSDGVWVTVYSNGVSVVVNYTGEAAEVEGHTVAAESAAALSL
ncbi:MAG TPA: hypothetical protein IAC67_03135 [Candidatus Coproplasma excrementipullorum]|nr:hypothetical protein [Candidatus Coproplasma excrementipullorum]